MEERAITDVHFVCLVMDFGELLGAKEGLTQMSKGKDVAGRLWQNYGMTLIMAGIGHKIPTKTYISKD